MTIGARVKHLRELNNLSQSELAAMINVSSSSVSMWETDKREICQDELIKLSNIFKVSTDYLLGIDKEANAIDVAFYNQLGELTPEQKLDIIRYAEFVRSKNHV
jgi:transcriptional regulator with XRE-family HTH domain